MGLFCLAAICWVLSVPSAAQGIVVKPEEVIPRLKTGLPNALVFYVNGDGMTWSSQPQDNSVDVGAFQKSILALAALRLVDAGELSLNTSLSSLVPGIVPPDPFRAPITITHLLQETAGFASPPEGLQPKPLDHTAEHSQLKKFAIIMRGPGQISSHDPVGWAILIAVLEKVADKPIETIIHQQVLNPVGIDNETMSIGHQSLGGRAMPLNIEMAAWSLSKGAALLVENKDIHNNLYLARGTYQDLTQGRGGHQLHPHDSIASYGIQVSKSETHRWLEPLNRQSLPIIDWLAFPEQGAVFGAVSNDAAYTDVNIRKNALELAREFFPPRAQKPTGEQSLARPSRLEGRYVPANRSPAGLSERLDILQSDWLTLYAGGDGQLLVKRRDGDPVPYRETSPYAYSETVQNSLARDLLFSPYKLGGYVALKGEGGERRLYRRVDSLGRAAQLAALLPWALLIIASAGLYAVRQPAKPWRNMGLFALAGAALVSSGLYFEINNWAAVLYTQNQPALITLWRTGLNIGLMLLLAVPMFVVSFSRNKTIPSSGLKILVGPHLALVAAAALTVFLTLVMWGVAGTFAPY